MCWDLAWNWVYFGQVYMYWFLTTFSRLYELWKPLALSFWGLTNYLEPLKVYWLAPFWLQTYPLGHSQNSDQNSLTEVLGNFLHNRLSACFWFFGQMISITEPILQNHNQALNPCELCCTFRRPVRDLQFSAQLPSQYCFLGLNKPPSEY